MSLHRFIIQGQESKLKHILESYKDKQLPEQVKEKLEKADNFKDLLHLHSQLKKISKDWEIGIEIKKQ